MLQPLHTRQPTALTHSTAVSEEMPPQPELEDGRQDLALAWDPPLVPEPPQAAQQVEPLFSKQTLAPLPWALADI